MSGLTKDDKRRFNEHVRSGKLLESEGRYDAALAEYSTASAIFGAEHDTLKKKIASLNRKLAMSQTTAEENSVPDAYQCSPATPRSCDGPVARETTTSAVLPIAAVARGHLHESGDFELPGGFCLNHAIADKLFPHQREGIAWMWSLHGSRIGSHGCDATVPGGCLADDMGLGKTVQVVAFLAGLFSSRKARRALVVAPLSVLAVWEREFETWAPFIRVEKFHGKRNARAVADVMQRGGVLLSTYGTCTANPGVLGAMSGRSAGSSAADDNESAPSEQQWESALAPGHWTPGNDATVSWDVVVLDEGHKIKNPATQAHKVMQAIPAKYRLLLSGTPIQNNLDELWALVDYFTWGSLFGTRRTFNREIGDLIVAGRDKSALPEDMRRGEAAASRLMHLLRPHLLRREKEVLRLQATMNDKRPQGDLGSLTAGIARMALAPPTAAMGAMGRKKEVVVWCTMPPPQIEAYKSFLDSERVSLVLGSEKCSALTAIAVLRKISCHPALYLHAEASVADADPASTPWSKAGLPPSSALLETGGKLLVLLRLLLVLRQEGHRVLVFSQSSRMLDVMERVLDDLPMFAAGERALRYLRIDGSVPAHDRSRIVNRFNDDSHIDLCLLTTGVGSLGLTLTSATRVVIHDMSWNPSTDAQAVDRAYRLGQVQDVVSYRLIACGSIDEAIYRNQLFKGGLTKSVIDGSGAGSAQYRGGWTARLLSRSDLRELFTLGSTTSSDTKAMLDDIGLSPPQSVSTSIDNHLLGLPDALGGREACCGISHHDELLLLSGEVGGLDAELSRVHHRTVRTKAAPVVASSVKDGLVLDLTSHDTVKKADKSALVVIESDSSDTDDSKDDVIAVTTPLIRRPPSNVAGRSSAEYQTLEPMYTAELASSRQECALVLDDSAEGTLEENMSRLDYGSSEHAIYDSILDDMFDVVKTGEPSIENSDPEEALGSAGCVPSVSSSTPNDVNFTAPSSVDGQQIREELARAELCKVLSRFEFSDTSNEHVNNDQDHIAAMELGLSLGWI